MDVWGEALRLTIFGESHGAGVGCVLSGFPEGMRVDQGAVQALMARRATDSPRAEQDEVAFLSGLSPDGFTTGAPVALHIANRTARSADYENLPARPSHADYPAFVKYGGFGDRRGGGRFSGRMTAPLCAAGALCLQYLARRGVRVQVRVTRIGAAIEPEDFASEIEAARREGDSVGGEIECEATGLPVGLGEPFFDSVESVLSHILFSIPGIKGVEFGAGFALCSMRGSQANDPMGLEDGRVVHAANRMGGADGGIANGAPLVLRVAVKPTPSIAKEQRTVSLPPDREEIIAMAGRHDPCIAPRAAPAVEAAVGIGLMDLWLRGGEGHGG